MTYHAHDVDDGLEAGLITESELEELALWRMARDRARDLFPVSSGSARLEGTIRKLLDLQVEDAIRTSAARLEALGLRSPEEIRLAETRVVALSDRMREAVEPLRAFLFQKVYFHPSVAGANHDSVELMRRLFRHYLEQPETMGRKARARVATEGLPRTVCDYIAGMTDRYALEEVVRFGLAPGADSVPDCISGGRH
jgi:dGTPase